MPQSRRSRALAVGSILALVVALASVEYTVEPGDTLGRIAKEYGVSVAELAEANSIANPDLIHPGQILLIPGVDGKPERIHIVERGETLHRIAGKYDTNAASIAKANSLKNPDLILPGQELLIPGSLGSKGPKGDDPDPGTSVPRSRSGRFHIVSRGETVDSIAAKYKGVTAAGIIEANGIVKGMIYTGTRLFLDGPGYIATGTKGTSSYTVKRGDRLGDIAARYGTTVSVVAEANDLQDANLIRRGQVLRIPAGRVWACPVDGGTFFNDWGFPRGGGARYHEGNDLFASYGTPVRAPVSGKITFVVGSVGGNQFNLRGDDGVTYLGSHMDAFEGGNRPVSAGEVVGYIGTTGNAQGTRPHLHLGMYLDGLAVNPYPSLLANGCK
jgi:LysM repeat protein